MDEPVSSTIEKSRFRDLGRCRIHLFSITLSLPQSVREWSLALIGNASGQIFGAEGISIRGVFDKETRRKPLGFAADAVRYGI